MIFLLLVLVFSPWFVRFVWTQELQESLVIIQLFIFLPIPCWGWVEVLPKGLTGLLSWNSLYSQLFGFVAKHPPKMFQILGFIVACLNFRYRIHSLGCFKKELTHLPTDHCSVSCWFTKRENDRFSINNTVVCQKCHWMFVMLLYNKHREKFCCCFFSIVGWGGWGGLYYCTV